VVGNYRATPGNYSLRLDLAGHSAGVRRQLQQRLHQRGQRPDLSSGGDHRTATVAGTIMAPENTNTDEDYYNLGVLNAGMWWN